MSSAKPSLELLRSLTDEHVLRALMAHRKLTRAEVAGLTGISKPTISEAFRRLEHAGVVVDTGERSRGRGRAGSYYSLSPACGAALVVGITAQGVVAETVDAYGDRTGTAEVALDRDADAGGAARAVAQAVAAVAGVPGALPIRTAAVSAADPVDRASGRLVHLPDSPFLVGDLDPASLLAEAVDGPVLVDNDVNWAARAEQSAAAGGAAGCRDFVYLYLDEGLGCAVVADGEVRRGHSGLAGEIAHLVTTGPGDRAMPLTRVFAELGLRRAGSTAVDLELVRTADRATCVSLGTALCGVLAAVVALTDPEIVVVGGGWGRDTDFLAELSRQAARLPRPVPVAPAGVVERPPLAGARSAALEQLRDLIVLAAREPSAP
ncbi:ROK family transcriptional regulator [Terrabacter sp. 2RAF25]|uniref:ROK family transcriptional regulator n=1 Tax=Terrabacter sp. 2RAF25 TaxID=3232998 RepID=UPI003F9A957A